MEEIEVRDGLRVIKAEVPLAEMFGYATTLRSLSQGRATYTMQPLAYRPIPRGVEEALFAEGVAKKRRAK